MSSKKARLKQSLSPFLLVFLIFLFLRWALVEPFVIPSGSMMPTLLVNDHIAVSKWSYGLRWPFSRKWIVRWGDLQRFDVVVFMSVENPSIHMIKRVIGLPGDRVEFKANGQVLVNDEILPRELLSLSGAVASDDEDFEIYLESFKKYKTQLKKTALRWDSPVYTVPENSFFAVGDNRDQSLDSRTWGFVPQSHLVGRARTIWLSCKKTIYPHQSLCDPATFRFERFFKTIH